MYRTICTELWSDPDIKSLDVSTKLLFVYLITNPHTHLCGMYYLPLETLLKETGIKLIPYRYGIDTLSRLEKAFRDDRTETFLVTNMFAYQGQGPKNEAAAAKHLRTLHHSSLILKFLTRYPHIKDLLTGYPIDTLSDLEKSCPSVPDPDSDSVLLTNPKIRSNGHAEAFEQFWRVYPKKVGKKAAQKAWQQATDKPAVIDIVKVLEVAKTSDQWIKENGKFIPHPSTWLNEGRWDDQVMAKSVSTTEAFLSRGTPHDKTRLS